MCVKSFQPCQTLATVCTTAARSELPCPPSGDLPDPGVRPTSLMPPVMGGFFTTSATSGAHWRPWTASNSQRWLSAGHKETEDSGFVPPRLHPWPPRWPHPSTASAPDSSPSSRTPIFIRFLYSVSLSSDFTGSNSFQQLLISGCFAIFCCFP